MNTKVFLKFYILLFLVSTNLFSQNFKFWNELDQTVWIAIAQLHTDSDTISIKDRSYIINDRLMREFPVQVEAKSVFEFPQGMDINIYSPTFMLISLNPPQEEKPVQIAEFPKNKKIFVVLKETEKGLYLGPQRKKVLFFSTSYENNVEEKDIKSWMSTYRPQFSQYEIIESQKVKLEEAAKEKAREDALRKAQLEGLEQQKLRWHEEQKREAEREEREFLAEMAAKKAAENIIKMQEEAEKLKIKKLELNLQKEREAMFVERVRERAERAEDAKLAELEAKKHDEARKVEQKKIEAIEKKLSDDVAKRKQELNELASKYPGVKSIAENLDRKLQEIRTKPLREKENAEAHMQETMREIEQTHKENTKKRSLDQMMKSLSVSQMELERLKTRKVELVGQKEQEKAYEKIDIEGNPIVAKEGEVIRGEIEKEIQGLQSTEEKLKESIHDQKNKILELSKTSPELKTIVSNLESNLEDIKAKEQNNRLDLEIARAARLKEIEEEVKMEHNKWLEDLTKKMMEIGENSSAEDIALKKDFIERQNYWAKFKEEAAQRAEAANKSLSEVQAKFERNKKKAQEEREELKKELEISHKKVEEEFEAARREREQREEERKPKVIDVNLAKALKEIFKVTPDDSPEKILGISINERATDPIHLIENGFRQRKLSISDWLQRNNSGFIVQDNPEIKIANIKKADLAEKFIEDVYEKFKKGWEYKIANAPKKITKYDLLNVPPGTSAEKDPFKILDKYPTTNIAELFIARSNRIDYLKSKKASENTPWEVYADALADVMLAYNFALIKACNLRGCRNPYDLFGLSDKALYSYTPEEILGISQYYTIDDLLEASKKRFDYVSRFSNSTKDDEHIDKALILSKADQEAVKELLYGAVVVLKTRKNL